VYEEYREYLGLHRDAIIRAWLGSDGREPLSLLALSRQYQVSDSSLRRFLQQELGEEYRRVAHSHLRGSGGPVDASGAPVKHTPSKMVVFKPPARHGQGKEARLVRELEGRVRAHVLAMYPVKTKAEFDAEALAVIHTRLLGRLGESGGRGAC
jgi:hypothetical protein